MDDLTRVVGLG
jgi:uncharacterized membrane protein